MKLQNFRMRDKRVVDYRQGPSAALPEVILGEVSVPETSLLERYVGDDSSAADDAAAAAAAIEIAARDSDWLDVGSVAPGLANRTKTPKSTLMPSQSVWRKPAVKLFLLNFDFFGSQLMLLAAMFIGLVVSSLWLG